MNRRFEVVLMDRQEPRQVVVDERPTLRGAMSAAEEWRSRIVRAGRYGRDEVLIRQKAEEGTP